MAQALTCDLCDSEPAAMMQTVLATGASLAVGSDCMLIFTLGAAAGLSEGIPPEVAAEYADQVAALLANLAPSMLQLAKSATPKPPRRTKPAAGSDTPEVPIAADAGNGTASAASTDGAER